jgi:hypothetical protein
LSGRVVAEVNRIKDNFLKHFLKGFVKQGSWSLHNITPKANLQQLFFFKCGKNIGFWIEL